MVKNRTYLRFLPTYGFYRAAASIVIRDDASQVLYYRQVQDVLECYWIEHIGVRLPSYRTG